MPKRAKKAGLMKGRPITREEFEPMLAKVPAVVGDKVTPSWRYRPQRVEHGRQAVGYPQKGWGR